MSPSSNKARDDERRRKRLLRQSADHEALLEYVRKASHQGMRERVPLDKFTAGSRR
jgi:hypothetical protein